MQQALKTYLIDAPDILAISISQLCNLSIKLNSFTRSKNFKMVEVKLFLKKAPKLTLKANALFHCSSSYHKLSKGYFMTKYRNLLAKTKLSTDFNLISEKNYFTNACLGYLTNKITTGFDKRYFYWNDLNWLTKF